MPDKRFEEIAAEIVIAMINKDLLSVGTGADAKIKNVCDAYKEVYKTIIRGD